MWNMISCNKITEERIRQKSYEKHVEKVNKMKSKLKISQPEQPWFVYAKKKRELAKNCNLYLKPSEQLLDIQKNNHLLLSKIKTIEQRENSTFKRPSFIETLNGKIMRETNNEIFKENRRICQKILVSDSFYKTRNILEKSNNLQKLMQNISMNARRVQSAKSLASSKSKISRPLSSINLKSRINNQGSQFKQYFSKHSESRFTRPQSAPSIKRAKSAYQKFKIDDQNSPRTQQN